MRFLLSIISILFIAGCSGDGVKGEAKYPHWDRDDLASEGGIYGEKDTIFGEGGFGAVLTGKNRPEGKDQDNVLNINAHLWRASLDTISFIPLQQVDPFGGVILTDWYSAPETPNKRYKLNVFITDKQLRASAVKVTMFKQERSSEKGAWKDSAVATEDTRKIEDAILTRARQLRIEKLDS